MKLTERKIETLTADRGQKDRLVFDDAQRGLAVRVTAAAAEPIFANTRLIARNGVCRWAPARRSRCRRRARQPPRSWAIWQREGTRRPSARKRQRPNGQSACGAASRSRY